MNGASTWRRRGGWSAAALLVAIGAWWAWPDLELSVLASHLATIQRTPVAAEAPGPQHAGMDGHCLVVEASRWLWHFGSRTTHRFDLCRVRVWRPASADDGLTVYWARWLDWRGKPIAVAVLREATGTGSANKPMPAWVVNAGQDWLASAEVAEAGSVAGSDAVRWSVLGAWTAVPLDAAPWTKRRQAKRPPVPAGWLTTGSRLWVTPMPPTPFGAIYNAPDTRLGHCCWLLVERS